MPEMVAAYIRYCAEEEMPTRPRETPQPGPPAAEEVYEITVVDMFGAFLCFLFAFATEC
jgi:hypothetical protein